jgi:hypothetical protein
VPRYEESDDTGSRGSSPLNFPQYNRVDSPDTSGRSHSTKDSRSERKQIYDLRKQLIEARSQVQALRKRAAEQDGEMQTLVSLVKQVNEARLSALQEAARANEELR